MSNQTTKNEIEKDGQRAMRYLYTGLLTAKGETMSNKVVFETRIDRRKDPNPIELKIYNDRQIDDDRQIAIFEFDGTDWNMIDADDWETWMVDEAKKLNAAVKEFFTENYGLYKNEPQTLDSAIWAKYSNDDFTKVEIDPDLNAHVYHQVWILRPGQTYYDSRWVLTPRNVWSAKDRILATAAEQEAAEQLRQEERIQESETDGVDYDLTAAELLAYEDHLWEVKETFDPEADEKLAELILKIDAAITDARNYCYNQLDPRRKA